MYRHLLVPMDESILAGATVEQAVTFAKTLGAKISFVHVCQDFASTSDGVLIEVMNPESFNLLAHGRGRALLAKAESAAINAGVLSTSYLRVSNSPHKVILSLAEQLECDLIFMASHRSVGLNSFIHGSVSQKILKQTSCPILISQIESNRKLSAAERTVIIIKNEHRSLSSVSRSLGKMLNKSHEEYSESDFLLMMRMLFFITDFSQKLHHPKEDSYLFDVLRQRTAAYDAILTDLEKQHIDEAGMLATLRELLAGFVSGDKDQGVKFFEEFQRFLEWQCSHMKCEEKVVLPAAVEYFLDSDWKKLVKAFEENGDPIFNHYADDSFKNIFTQLINQVESDKENNTSKEELPDSRVAGVIS